ncbi:MAG: LysM peptidoglycan-binding domain-containing protein [Phototrophicaceae bacterium]
MRYRIILLGLCLSILWGVLPTFAQTNLLNNGGLEQGSFGNYVGTTRSDLTIPVGWSLWLPIGSTAGYYDRGDRVFGFPHQGVGPAPVEGATAANFSGGYVQYRMALYQAVNVAAGTALRAEVTTQVKSCTPANEGSGCGSSLESGASTRIGIDPDGGNDPAAAEVVWSAFLEPHDQWLTQSVEATATGGTVTVFIYHTQRVPNTFNNVWIDNVKLFQGGGGGAAPSVATAVPGVPIPTATPAQQYAQFVNPQGSRDDGSVVHTVASGDTLAAISVAYGVPATTIISLNPQLGNGAILQLGQQITISQGSSSAPSNPTPAESASASTQPQATEEPLVEVINTDPKRTGQPLDVGGILDLASVAVAENPTATIEPTADLPTMTPIPTGEAPVVASNEVIPAVDMGANTATVCLSMFEDVNQNRYKEADEPLLPSSVLQIRVGTEMVVEYETDGESEPKCFTELEAQTYTINASPAVGYGLTTPTQLQVPLTAGSVVNLAFGAAQGIQSVPLPEGGDFSAFVTNTNATNSPTTVEEPASLLDQLLGISGIIVVGIAAVIVLAGIGVAVVLRRA